MDDLVRLLDLLGAACANPPAITDCEPLADPPLAVATVVNTRGSAYRRPGARMLIRQSMSVQGAVSAGCLERDIIAHCELLRESDKPLLLTYDGTSPDELIFGLKLGCDGIVQVLLEPIVAPANQSQCQPVFEQLQKLLPELLSAHGRVVVVTLFDLVKNADANAAFDPVPVKAGIIMLDTGTRTYQFDTSLPGPVALQLCRQARYLLLDPQGGQSFVLKQEIEGYAVSALIEIVEPITALCVFGSGQDVDPLVKIADVLGWRVTTMSNSQVDRLDWEQLSSLLGGQYMSAAVVMTHDYERDRKILRALFAYAITTAGGIIAGCGTGSNTDSSNDPVTGICRRSSDLSYIGVVGPRRRADKLVAELALAGVPITDSQLSRFFSPVGLDLGAERPEEIALSIVAEIKAVLAGHGGGLLREKQGPIHKATGLKGNAVAENSVTEAADTVSPVIDAAVQTHSISASCRWADD